MSDIKRSCPVCGSCTSAVGMAVAEGERCPYCGTPAATILEIDATRERLGDEALKARVEELLRENAKLTTERDELEKTLESVRWALREGDLT